LKKDFITMSVTERFGSLFCCRMLLEVQPARGIITMLLWLLLIHTQAQELSENVRRFVEVDHPTVALINAKVIDGTGQPIPGDLTVLIVNGLIQAVEQASTLSLPSGTHVINCEGKTLLPGMVMLHEHMFYSKPFEGTFSVGQMSFTFPRLYLAGGCTTIRTGGSIQPTSDLMIKKWIDEGKMTGPKMDVTGPFITTTDVGILELAGLKENNMDAADMVNYWADKGATSFKVYTSITKSDLQKVVQAAHARNLKVTGHLCSVTYREAAEIGIDNLEHGFFTASDFIPNKYPDECDPFKMQQSLGDLDKDSEEMKSLMQFLINKGVAVTTTLPVFEPYKGREIVPGGGLSALTPDIREQVSARYQRGVARQMQSNGDEYFRKQMTWEKRFHDLGGNLVAGTDPTGAGRVVPGYANQHVVELLVEASFTIEEAVKIVSLHGARYLELDDEIGTIAVGKKADLILIDGDLKKDVENIRKMEIVFKDGIGYSSPKMFDSVKGKVGLH